MVAILYKSGFRKPIIYNIATLPADSTTSPNPVLYPEPPAQFPPQVVAPITDLPKTPAEAVAPLPSPSLYATKEQLKSLQVWAKERGILLQGITKDINSLYYNKYNSATDHIELAKVEYVSNILDALKLLPDSVLVVMQGKTIYISTISERPYTILAGDYLGTLKGLNEGIILTQPLGFHNTIHEFGHILGYHGIEGLYDQNYPQFKQYIGEYQRIFDAEGITYPPSALPQGYMSIYSTANRAENFAEHLAFYVLSASEFRQKASTDAKILEKYKFLKEKVFAGKEY